MQLRSFVASKGLDTNDGKLATPCRSIGAALAQTTPGGEIVVLDSAGYGTVTINQSVAIVAPPGIYAGITVAAGTGVDVAAGVVTLRGLTIRGAGGAVGIHVGNATVHIDGCAISAFGQFGIHADTANADVHVRNTTITECSEGLRFDRGARFALERVSASGNGNIGLNVVNGARGSARDLVCARNGNHGIGVSSAAVGATCYFALDGGVVATNGAAGLSAGIPGPVAGKVDVSITRSSFVGNGTDGIAVSTQGQGTCTALVSDTVIDANALRGVAAMNAGALAVVCGNRITRNGGAGLSQSGGSVVRTEQDNMLDGNNAGGAQTSGALVAIAAV